MQELAGRVAVVTGAASGIGRALAERFAAEGMRVLLADIEREALDRTAAELDAAGSDVACFQLDVSNPDDVQRAAEFALERFGRVHVLCNNAGVGIGGVIWEHSPEDWRWLVDVNVLGVVNGLRAFVPLMLEHGEECHIVNTASAAGLDARAWLGMYSATKYAVVAISEALRAELQMRNANIGVSVLCPAVVNTRIAESDRNRPQKSQSDPDSLPADASAFGEAFRAALAQGMPPEKVADAVVDAVRHGRFYITTHPETDERVRARFDAIVRDAGNVVESVRPGDRA